jgi:hypothetical protein
MDDSVGVGNRESVRDLDGDREGGHRLEGPAVDELAQGRAFHELEDDVVEAVLLPDVVDGLDVRVVEGGHEAGFALEPAARGIAACEVGTEGLDDDGPREPRVLGLVRGGLPPMSQRLEDPIVRKRLTRCERDHGTSSL